MKKRKNKSLPPLLQLGLFIGILTALAVGAYAVSDYLWEKDLQEQCQEAFLND